LPARELIARFIAGIRDAPVLWITYRQRKDGIAAEWKIKRSLVRIFCDATVVSGTEIR